jgi:hypothetical protein
MQLIAEEHSVMALLYSVHAETPVQAASQSVPVRLCR